MLIYEVDPGDADISVGCIIKISGTGTGSKLREQIQVIRAEQSQHNPIYEENEELMSNIIIVSVIETFRTQGDVSIALPYLNSRLPPHRELAIKAKFLISNSCWEYLENREVNFDAFKEHRFLETTIQASAFTGVIKLVIVSLLKKEVLDANWPEDSVIKSEVDRRIMFTFRENNLKKPIKFEIMSQPVDIITIQEIKKRNGDTFKSLIGSSCLLRIRNLTKPTTLTMPVNPPPFSNPKHKRPATGMSDNRSNNASSSSFYNTENDSNSGGQAPSSSKSRPKTAPKNTFRMFIKPVEEDLETSLTLLTKDSDDIHCKWSVVNGIRFQESVKQDIATFDLERPIPHRVLVVRHYLLSNKYSYQSNPTDNKIQNVPRDLELMAKEIEKTLTTKRIYLLVRQVDQSPCLFTQVHLLSSVKLERAVKKLKDEGYSKGPKCSQEIVINEGQTVSIRFRGNLVDSQQRKEIKTIFNSNLKTCIVLQLAVADRYAQRALDCFKGFIQVFISQANIHAKSKLISFKQQHSTIQKSHFKQAFEENDSSYSTKMNDELEGEKPDNNFQTVQTEAEYSEETSSSSKLAKITSSFNLFQRMASRSKITENGSNQTLNPISQFALLSGPGRKVYGDLKLACELLVTTPKPDDEPLELHITRAPIVLKPDGIVNSTLFEILSEKIGEEWVQLAETLNVRRMRVESLIRQKAANKKAAFDILMTWIKRMPRSANKVEILTKALNECGRRDLAKIIQDRNMEMRNSCPLYSKEALMTRAMRTISSNPHLIYDWKLFACELGIEENSIASIQSKYYNTRERFLRVITRWQEAGYDNGNGVRELIRCLRASKCIQLADMVEKEYKR